MPKECIGSRQTFAFEIADDESRHSDLRRVNVCAAGIHLTCDDDTMYIPQFLNSLTCDLDRLVYPSDRRRDTMPFTDLSPQGNHRRLLEIAEEDSTAHLYHRFMDWGPTADNVSMHYFRIGDTIYLPFSFWRESHHNANELGNVFCATVALEELRSTFHRAAWKLMWDWSSLKQNRDGGQGDDPQPSNT